MLGGAPIGCLILKLDIQLKVTCFDALYGCKVNLLQLSASNSISMLANRSHNFNVSELNPRTDFTISLFLVGPYSANLGV